MSAKNVILTDVANGKWVESFQIADSEELRLNGSADWSISKQTLRGGPSDGVDVVTIDNGAFEVSVLPTRGMGLWRGQYRQIELGWSSPAALPVNPTLVNLTDRSGLGWLAGFNEWMCRCGLSSTGAPGLDVVLDNQGNSIETPLTLHGKIANTPAHRVEINIETANAGTLSVTGEVDEAMLFGPRLRLVSTLKTEAGSNRLEIIDRVTNLGGQPAELELLYHTNMGRPLLEEGSKIVAPVREVAPCNDRAAENFDSWNLYAKPVSGYTEQNYFLDLLTDADDCTTVLLKNASSDKGISLHFSTRQLPCFTVWKNTQAEEDGYVTGLEPGTSYPNLKAFEREQGRVIFLDSGQTYETRLELAVHASAEDVSVIEQRIQSLQGNTVPRIHSTPQPTRTPGG